MSITIPEHTTRCKYVGSATVGNFSLIQRKKITSTIQGSAMTSLSLNRKEPKRKLFKLTETQLLLEIDEKIRQLSIKYPERAKSTKKLSLLTEKIERREEKRFRSFTRFLKRTKRGLIIEYLF